MILYGRYWELTVGGNRIRWDDALVRPLTIRFSVEKSLDREPNKATLEVFNLSRSRREQWESLDEPEIQLIAGYQASGLHDTIFIGDASAIYSQTQDQDTSTFIEAQDGGSAYRTATITRTYEAGTSLATVIQSCAEALGVGIGNTLAVAATATLDSGGSVFPSGIALEGLAWRALDRVCRSASLRWSVQNGVLQLRGFQQAAETRAIRLSPDSGLIGSPTRSSKDPRTGVADIEVKSLLIPGIYPGRVVLLESQDLTGSYVCQSVRYTGETVGRSWYTETTLREYA